MKLTDEWFTSLSHTEGGQLVFVTVRKELEQFIASGSLRVRVAISWPYAAEADGMPDEATAQLLEEIEPLPTFGERLNACLAPYPTLPLEIDCQEDPDWTDYREMLQMEQDEDED